MASRSILTDPPPDRLPLVAASILSADFARMGQECRSALDAGADLLHLDVMDGHFVPNLTMGPAMCRSLRAAMPDVCLDVHLMVADPSLFVQPFAEAGASNLTFHIEAVPQPGELSRRIRGAGMTAGLALNPGTAAEAILPHAGEFDVILIMSVNPGYAGQEFIDSVLAKARAIKPQLKAHQRLEIDGGVNPATAGACIAAGCEVLVAASAIFNHDDYAMAVRQLRHPPRGARPQASAGAAPRSIRSRSRS